MLNIIFTVAAGMAFTATAVFCYRALKLGTTFPEAVFFVGGVATANALFRAFTLYHRIFSLDLPQPETTRIALFLQVCLAMALLLIAAVTKIRSDVTKNAV